MVTLIFCRLEATAFFSWTTESSEWKLLMLDDRRPCPETEPWKLIRFTGKLNFPPAVSQIPPTTPPTMLLALTFVIEHSGHGRHRCNRVTIPFFFFSFSFCENLCWW